MLLLWSSCRTRIDGIVVEPFVGAATDKMGPPRTVDGSELEDALCTLLLCLALVMLLLHIACHAQQSSIRHEIRGIGECGEGRSGTLGDLTRDYLDE